MIPTVKASLRLLLLLVLAMPLAARADDAPDNEAAVATEEVAILVDPTEDSELVLEEIERMGGIGNLLEGEREVAEYVAAVRELDPSLPAQVDTGFHEDPLTWMPQDAAARASDVDLAYNFILWVCYIFGGIVIVLMFVFLFKYKAKDDSDPDPVGTASHSTTLEITWTVIPTCIVLVMFTIGFKGYLNDQIAPPNAYQINVVGGSWYWNFEYPNGAVTTHLHLPKGRPVEFTLKSQDVIHSFYIPAFRVKKDVVPGRFNKIWATPTKTGVFELFCTEYCGILHSRMGAKVFVHEPEEFETILAKVSNLRFNFDGTRKPPAEVGEALWAARGCTGCHSIDGSTGTGPTWKDLWNAPNHAMVDGTIVEVDEEYIRESIFYPGRQIVAGYGNAMASYLGILSEEDVSDIIAYMKTISVHTEDAGVLTQKTPAGMDGRVEADEATGMDSDAREENERN
jgi:cytochrome c oxidase subunit 2